ncbi:linear amide C-N hydrolase [Sulfurimonas sp.]
MKKFLIKVLSISTLLSISPIIVNACTSFVIKTQDGSPIYGRTMEWGAFDLQSDLVLVPRNLSFTSELGGGKQGMKWKNKFGYVAINAVKQPFITDGMNEMGLTVGVLYFPGFAKYQKLKAGEESMSMNNVELSNYILGQFKTVGEIKETLPKIRVIHNKDIDKVFGAPSPLHVIVTDNTGASIVIEYVGGVLKIHDNKIGVMTNSPNYEWHILNLRNYPQLRAFGNQPDRQIQGVSLAPFGAGSGMLGLPGDVTPVSRFVRAVAFTQTLIPPKNVEAGVNEAGRILNNFDIPRGLVREGESTEKYHLNFTQWSTIGDIKNKRYYWWTEHNRRMRMVDLKRLNFKGNQISHIPLDEVRTEDIKDCTKALTSH